MKKYLTVFSLSFQEVFVYRWASLIYFSFSFINILLSMAVWTVAYKTSALRADIDYSQFISYFILIIFFHSLVQSYRGNEMSEVHIKRGELSVLLLKPISYFSYMIFREIPWRIMHFIFAIPTCLFLFYFFGVFNQLSLNKIIISLLLVPFCYLLSFFIQTLFAMSAFFLDEARGILNFLMVLILIFSGSGIPLFFFPPKLLLFSKLLPFQYYLYFPVTLAMGRVSYKQALINIVILLFWLLSVSLLTRLIFNKGLRRFTGEGI